MRLLCAASSAALSAVCAFLLASGCGSDAVGVDACRDIEKARCEAGQHCPKLVDDVEECQRFYRDHCLHGLKSSSTPGDPQVGDCVDAIKLAGQCARDGVEHLADCPGWLAGTELATPCDAIKFPEKISACDFLVEPVEAGLPTKDTGTDTSIDDAASDALSDSPGDSAEGG